MTVPNVEHGVGIDANRADEEPFRLDRLDLVRRLVEYHEHTLLVKSFIDARVYFLYDHKGVLGVGWTKTPTKEQMALMLEFWEVLCECEIQHFVDRTPVEDGFWDEAPFPAHKEIGL